MFYIEDAELKNNADKADQHLIFDGTVNLDYSDEDQVPRVKGLIQLVSHYFSEKPD